MFSQIKHWARTIKTDAHAVYLAARDPRIPWFAKILAIAVAAYALSPIDLIPDFIPVLGYLDDLIIVPAGIWLVVALVPADVMDEYRAKAREAAGRPTSRAGMIAIILLWIASASLLGWIGYRYWTRGPA
ncbi:DUF1232 domain-containing protein [Tardiphaga alba]|uniref:DUF1232 domain-containing protein n=1 Tax=Tardiphaga alba TaxID=340268 RepID=A0ABX8AG40_9BRAD|nr:DUF1232 domain-containing protein [Tardiphaga alba]